MPSITPARGLVIFFRWASLIAGTVLLVLLLWLLICHLVGDPSEQVRMLFNSNDGILDLLLFPVCTIMGLVLAYKWPFGGGAVEVASILMLLQRRADLLQTSLVWLFVPGLLYMAYGWIKRQRALRG